MQCDDAAKQADDRDASIINGIFTAGLILQSEAVRVASGDVIGHVERAIEELDNAMRDICSAATNRRQGSRRRGSIICGSAGIGCRTVWCSRRTRSPGNHGRPAQPPGVGLATSRHDGR
jgi:hypothetical protein